MSFPKSLTDLLDKTLRLTLCDHRVVEGTLISVDKFGNILLSDACEYTYKPISHRCTPNQHQLVVVKLDDIYRCALIDSDSEDSLS